MKKYLKNVAAIVVALAMVFTLVPVQPVQAASKPKLSTTKKTLLVGSKMTLKVKNAKAGSTFTWKSSNKEAVTVSKKGVVKAKAGGESIVTCKVKTGSKAYSLKANIKVKDSVTAATQKELTKALANDGIVKIKLKTDAKKKFTITKGNYKNKLLIVEAPNADVANNGGVFKRIAIRSIASNTWIERASGNKFTVSADDSRIVVGKNGNVDKITYTKEGAKGTVDVRGSVGTVSVQAPTSIEVTGSTTEPVNIEVDKNAKGSEITADTQVSVTTETDVTVSLENGAEGSQVTTTEETVKAEVKNETASDVTVTTPSGNETVNTGAEATTGGNNSNNAGNNSNNNSSNTSSSSRPSGGGTSTTITLDKTTLELTEGDTAKITATVSKGTVTWTSSNEAVATVAADGTVTAVKAGTATITATVNGKTATCEVTVKAAPSGGETTETTITLNKTSLNLVEGGKETLTATVSPENVTVTWTSSNEAVAIVNNGEVTAVKAGTATITAKTADGKTATCEVTVKAAPSGGETTETTITLNKTSLNLVEGGKEILTATVSPSSITVTWTSSDEAVATVNNGEVTAVKAGTATVTAKTADGKTAACTVTVTGAASEVESVSLDETTLSMTIESTKKLTATVSPSSITVTWTSSDTSVATVSSDGTVTAVAAGTATITATAGAKTAACAVTVEANPEVIFAPLVDKTSQNPISPADIISGGAVTLNGNTIVFEGTELKAHENDSNTSAHWLGFGIELPNNVSYNKIHAAYNDNSLAAADMTQADYTDGGKEYFTLYFKMTQDGVANITSFKISFDEGATVYTYKIDVTGVTLYKDSQSLNE